MRLATLKREIIRDFGTERELTKFQKDMLSIIVLTFRLDYEIGEKFHEYIQKNQPDINALRNDFDQESKNEFNKFLSDLEYMKDHTVFETIKYLISNKEKILCLIPYVQKS